MPTLKQYENTDELHNPTSDTARELSRSEQQAADDASTAAGIDQLESYANDPKNASKNIDEVRRKEENAFNYQPSSSLTSRRRITLKGVFKGKKGPLGLLIGSIVGGAFGIGVMISPSLAVVHMKEVLTGDLNDQFAAMDIRSSHVLKAKFKDLGKTGTCTLIKVRCGLRGMSSKQISNFEKAGITVETGEDTVLGKKTVKSLTFTDANGKPVKITNAAKFSQLASDTNIRSQLRRAYNPKFYGLSDAVGTKILGKFGGKARKLTTNSKAQIDEEIDKSVAGEFGTVEEQKLTAADDKEKAAVDAQNAEFDKVTEGIRSSTGGVRSVFTGALKGASALGAVDSACTVYNTSRAASALAKIQRAAQLARYALVFLNFADSVKAGDATPEQAEAVGDTLASTDTEKTIVDETSTVKNGSVQKVANPDYGKSAYDSQAMHAAYYNDAPNITARTASMAVGGGLTGRLDSINKLIANKLGSSSPKDLQKKCGLVQNTWVRGGSLIIGIAAGVITLGWATAAQATASIGISLALPILQSYIADMLAGTVVSSKTKGVDAGNAIFSGTSVILGGMAMSRGMKPLNKSEIRSYLADTGSVKNEYVAMETKDAQSTPFDIANQYSFLGRLSRSLLPLKQQGSALSFGTVLHTMSFATSALQPKAGAVGDFNPARFEKCSDDAYLAIGIDADIMCNVRYGLSKTELAMDTDQVYQEMYSSYIDEDGNATGDYVDWLRDCVNREDGWGETSVEGGDPGERCLKNDHVSNLFRVYTMDRSIEEGMDNGPAAGTGASTGAGSNVRIASFNVWGATHSFSNYKERADKSINAIISNQVDIVGLQEFQTIQRDYFVSKMSGFDNYPKGANIHHGVENSIMWNTTKFQFVKGGYMPNLVYFEGSKLNAPWVLLKDKASGQQIYILNTHDPANTAQHPNNSQERYLNAKQHVKFVSELSKQNIPVLFTGDFNSGYDTRDSPGNNGYPYQGKVENLTYCVMTGSKVVNDTYDLYKQRPVKCPNPKAPEDRTDDSGGIDHVFATPGITSSAYTKVPSGQNGSDHVTQIYDVSIPGIADETAAGGAMAAGDISWPVDKKWWNSNRTDFLNAHTANSGTWTNGINSLAADISTPPDGTPVYAMFGGNVSRATLDSSEPHGLEITSSVQGGTLKIAYAHGPRTNQNSSYKAGDQIMKIGCLGNCTGGHLHIDMSFNGKGVCPQDVFIALGEGKTPNLQALTAKGAPPCGRT